MRLPGPDAHLQVEDRLAAAGRLLGPAASLASESRSTLAALAEAAAGARVAEATALAAGLAPLADDLAACAARADAAVRSAWRTIAAMHRALAELEQPRSLRPSEQAAATPSRVLVRRVAPHRLRRAVIHWFVQPYLVLPPALRQRRVREDLPELVTLARRLALLLDLPPGDAPRPSRHPLAWPEVRLALSLAWVAERLFQAIARVEAERPLLLLHARNLRHRLGWLDPRRFGPAPPPRPMPRVQADLPRRLARRHLPIGVRRRVLSHVVPWAGADPAPQELSR